MARLDESLRMENVTFTLVCLGFMSAIVVHCDGLLTNFMLPASGGTEYYVRRACATANCAPVVAVAMAVAAQAITLIVACFTAAPFTGGQNRHGIRRGSCCHTLMMGFRHPGLSDRSRPWPHDENLTLSQIQVAREGNVKVHRKLQVPPFRSSPIPAGSLAEGASNSIVPPAGRSSTPAATTTLPLSPELTSNAVFRDVEGTNTLSGYPVPAVAPGSGASTRPVSDGGAASSERPRRRAAGGSAPPPDGEPSEEGTVEWPKPLTAPERAVRALTFWLRVLPVLISYPLLQTNIELRKQMLGEDVLTDDQVERLYSELDEWGSERLAETIKTLKGFYVKTGQVISTRVDLFPPAYTTKLQVLQDGLDAMPWDLVRSVIEQDLLKGAGTLEEIFSKIDHAPLGAASIAQVHRATLLDGREVAVKVQRPNVEPKLRGDVGNLKSFAKRLAGVLPVDYYTVFCELEAALDKELDFLHEAQATEKIFSGISHTADGRASTPPVLVPLPIPGLASRRVLVMDYVDGVPLSRLGKETESQGGVANDSIEGKIVGTRLLEGLSEAFARMIFGTGFIHGDPHPGNIFVTREGKVALIDCGQVKQLSRQGRADVASLVLLVSAYDDTKPPDSRDNSRLCEEIAELLTRVGLRFDENAKGGTTAAAAALALQLFGPTGIEDLPGGYSSDELSEDSPLRVISYFPPDFVMLGRATVLIKGIASRLGRPWNLAQKWAPSAAASLQCNDSSTCRLPVYTTSLPIAALAKQHGIQEERTRLGDVAGAFANAVKLLGKWSLQKTARVLPGRAKSRLRKLGARILLWTGRV